MSAWAQSNPATPAPCAAARRQQQPESSFLSSAPHAKGAAVRLTWPSPPTGGWRPSAATFFCPRPFARYVPPSLMTLPRLSLRSVPPNLDFSFPCLMVTSFSFVPESVEQARGGGGGAEAGDHRRDGAGYPCQALRAAPSRHDCPWNGTPLF